jgi:signal transduction histidine kinase
MINRRMDQALPMSKFGFKIFLLFVLCALIPLLAISGVSYIFVTRQLKTDAYYRLRQQCKTKGFEIYERLTYLETELSSVIKEVNAGKWQRHDPQHYAPATREGSRFQAITRFMPNGSAEPVLGGRIPNPPAPESTILAGLKKGKSMVVVQNARTDRPDVFMIQPWNPDHPGQGYLVARIEQLYLWGIGAEGSLPPDVEMVVAQPGKQILVSSFRDDELSRPLVGKYSQSAFSGIFESRQKGRTFINAYWSLFLNHRFMTSDWVVILSQSKSSVLAPISSFSSIYFLLILLTFWIILLLAIISIRKRMKPVEALKAGAQKFANGQWKHRVDIQSGDEFEIVAEAFNEMGQKLEKSQAMLVQAAKMSTFGQMAAGIVHEIGQPLSSISGYTDLLAMTVTGEKPSRFLSIMQQEIRRLSGIISKFRTFSRTSPDIFSPIQINDVVHQTHRLLDHQLTMHDVGMQLDLQDKLPEILGDENGLQQVFLNLIMNSIDALEDKEKHAGRIFVRTYFNSGQVFAEVQDNGCGIPPHVQKDIFEPFFTTKSEEKGTGLGLAILQSILHKHNASIEMISEAGGGTCFKMAFAPRQQDPGAGRSPGAGHDLADQGRGHIG